ncbi:hypothetical protein [Geobacter sp. FeAm09]|uniref:hypothetical protein n=1 Tax=Geobacter sp. FeAm09 TaxID=2597769 RepID=UPI00143D2F61|nr:hypothetical protein [Geobacter sp. FeAm09]
MQSNINMLYLRAQTLLYIAVASAFAAAAFFGQAIVSEEKYRRFISNDLFY